MTNNVLLNNVDHHDLRVTFRHGAEHGDSVNQALIFPTEYEDVQREYPILFRQDESGAFQSVVLLGLDRDENLFLGESGWAARYVPAVHRRGPFMIGLQASKDDPDTREPMIHIDLDDPRVGREAGEPLFLPHGGNAPYLEHVAAVLRTLYSGIELAQPMFAAFDALGLIQPIELQIALDEETQYDLPGFFTIAQDRLADLGGEPLEQLNRAGYLRLAYLAAASLANVGRLIDLKNRKRAG
ncbi:SapC family protein [Sphingomonas sp. LB-2]|uniref:SapC family protein n=1 Tax=Sphingomonas caeni TaxID=2984949 RepID=UPI00222E3EDB|nr:SapC family protein [Sphingomonas caeni]MCW3848263.1 SapC family protein [Sphingomonas caeni]